MKIQPADFLLKYHNPSKLLTDSKYLLDYYGFTPNKSQPTFTLQRSNKNGPKGWPYYNVIKNQPKINNVYHPRNHVSISLGDDILSKSFTMQNYYANEAGQMLAKIHDYDLNHLSVPAARNLSDIVKRHDYWTDQSGRSHITRNDWLDMNGKSDKHLQWDANFWKNEAIGSNSEQKAMHQMEKAQNSYNYHNVKLDFGKPSNVLHERILLNKYSQNMNNYHNKSGKNWLAKINWAQGWANYHERKIDYMVRNRPKYQKRINNQIKLRDKWLNKAKQYTKHKNNDYNYYQTYQRYLNQRRYQEHMRQNWNEINSQINSNLQDGFSSIYRADGSDTNVVRVAEISPTEEVGMNIPTKSIDDKMPQTDWTQINQEQLSGQYTIYLSNGTPEDTDYSGNSQSYTDRVNQYVTLKRWAENGKLLRIRGFNAWDSILISDVQRSSDPSSSANAIQLQITFNYARLAHIKYAANKKAPGKPMRGRHNRKHPNNGKVTIHKYNTFSGFAQRFGGTVGEWERANPHARATDLQIGSKLNKPAEAK